MTRTGYTFTGWNDANTTSPVFSGVKQPGFQFEMPAREVVIKANWRVNVLTISYAGNGNTGGTAPSSPTSANYGANVAFPTNAYTKTGYRFAGWKIGSSSTIWTSGTKTAQELNSALGSGDASVVLTAQWTEQYQLTYDANGGSNPPAGGLFDAGATVTLATP